MAPLHATAAHRLISASSADARQNMSHTRAEAQFAASRLPSYQSQTKTRTVAVRFPAFHGKSQLRFAGSGSHSPPRWRTRERRCDSSLPLQEKSNSGKLPGWQSAPKPVDQHSLINLGRASPTLTPFRHTDRVFLRNLFTITRNRGEVNAICPTLGIFPPYSIECSAQAPFS